MSTPPNNPMTIITHWRWLLRWLAICIVLSVVVGSVVAFFLWALDQVTAWRWQLGWLLFLLPIAGVLSGLLYHRLGSNCEAGNSLIYARIRQCNQRYESINHKAKEFDAIEVPWHMAPLVLLGTLITHLFGGSAGREGTAVQMGGALASGLANWLRLSNRETATLLQAGVAAGFGAVFGTPLAATIFALEVVGRRVSKLASLPVCLCSAVLAERITNWWGIEHTNYSIDSDVLSFELLAMLKIFAMSIAFGAAAWLFIQSTHWINLTSQRLIQTSWLRTAIGGFLVLASVWLLGSREYLGLGVIADPRTPDAVCIVSSFSTNGADRFSWLWKIVVTSITVGFGFKGGEATPLFFIGSTLGNAMGSLLRMPVELAAGLGFVAVFAAATRTPLACTIMAVELFSNQAPVLAVLCLAVYALMACLVATSMQGGGLVLRKFLKRG